MRDEDVEGYLCAKFEPNRRGTGSMTLTFAALYSGQSNECDAKRFSMLDEDIEVYVPNLSQIVGVRSIRM